MHSKHDVEQTINATVNQRSFLCLSDAADEFFDVLADMVCS